MGLASQFANSKSAFKATVGAGWPGDLAGLPHVALAAGPGPSIKLASSGASSDSSLSSPSAGRLWRLQAALSHDAACILVAVVECVLASQVVAMLGSWAGATLLQANPVLNSR